MAKEGKDKKDKGKGKGKASGANASTFYVTARETGPVFKEGTVELDGDMVLFTYKKPRSASLITLNLHRNELYAFAVGTKDEGGYVVTDHPNLAAPVVSEVLTGYTTVAGGFVSGTNQNGLDCYINVNKVTPGAIRQDA